MRAAVLLRLILALTGLLAGLAFGTAHAAPSGERYFIDFRARPATHIGHTYVVYGRLAANGRVIELHYAGLVPEEDVFRGLLGTIRASVRMSEEDATLPPTAIYRRELTAAGYRQVALTVRYLQAVEHRWQALAYNCNSFGGAVADALGLRHPPSLMPPRDWVNNLRLLNEGD